MAVFYHKTGGDFNHENALAEKMSAVASHSPVLLVPQRRLQTPKFLVFDGNACIQPHFVASYAPSMKTFVLNGWAANEHAWDLCAFERDRVFSYVEQLDGAPEDAIAGERGPVMLVGWSMGGSGALRLACRFPGKTAALVLLAATPCMMADPESDWKGMTPRRLEALRYGLKLTRGAGFFGTPEGLPDIYDAADDANLERGLKYLLETDLRAKLERTFPAGCQAPDVAILQSERDGIVHPSNAAFLAHVFPCAKTEMVPGGEHAIPVSAHDLVDRAVRETAALACSRVTSRQ